MSSVLRMSILFIVQTRTHLKVKADTIINYSRTINTGKPGLFLEDEHVTTLGSHFLSAFQLQSLVLLVPSSSAWPCSYGFICKQTNLFLLFYERFESKSNGSRALSLPKLIILNSLALCTCTILCYFNVLRCPDFSLKSSHDLK